MLGPSSQVWPLVISVTSPEPGFLSFPYAVTPITVTGQIPAGWSGVSVDYTIGMPGFILESGQAAIDGSTFSLVYDPVTLNAEFPNLDLTGRDLDIAGLSDTIAIGLLLQGQESGAPSVRAATVTLQGEQVFVSDYVLEDESMTFLPIVIKGPP